MNKVLQHEVDTSSLFTPFQCRNLTLPNSDEDQSIQLEGPNTMTWEHIQNTIRSKAKG